MSPLFSKSPFTRPPCFATLRRMSRKLLILLFAPLLLVGCTSTFTNLTPHQQSRNPNNLYTLEVAMTSRQQSLRWDSIRPQIIIGKDSYPMRPTSLMTNRWEGLVPVAQEVNQVHYHYKFDFDYNGFGGPKPDSAMSPEYTLKILDQ
jgi:hypothetical protein